jgi:hypothetical protein
VEEMSLKCDETRDVLALALGRNGKAGANRFHAAHLSQDWISPIELSIHTFNVHKLYPSKARIKASSNLIGRELITPCTYSAGRLHITGAGKTAYPVMRELDAE